MVKYLTFILVASFTSISCSQVDSVDVQELSRILNSYDESDYKITEAELDCLKRAISDDVKNWVHEPNDTLENLWYKMIAQDTAVFVTIDLDTATYELDVIEEYKRRVVGGFAGSYPSAETWSFNILEDSLINAIKMLKINDRSLRVPNEKDLLIGRSSYWFHINLYDNENNEVIHIWTRGSSTNPPSSTLALVGYHKYVNPSTDIAVGIEKINSDFWKLENDKRIERFERMIVDTIKERL